MILFERNRGRERSGIVLIDLLVYISVLGLVLVLIGAVFHQSLINGGQLRRNIDDLERAMVAGERWRTDIRGATGAVRLETNNAAEFLVIPQGRGDVVYQFLTNAVWRWSPGRENPELALAGVRSARMFMEKRERAAGWRWELELDQRRKNAKVKPLFTFTAVPGG